MNEKASPRPHTKVYAGLALTWAIILVWLYVEHGSVANAARERLLNRARDISNTIALISRSGFQGAVFQSRLEEALNELVKSPQIVSIALLNSSGEVVVSAGPPMVLNPENFPNEGTRWEKDIVTIINPVEFGDITDSEGKPLPTIVIPPRGSRPEREEQVGPQPVDRDREAERNRERSDEDRPPPPPPFPDDPGAESNKEAGNQSADTTSHPRHRVFRRPSWLSQEEFDELIRKRGLHGFAIVLKTDSMDRELHRDLALRVFLGIVTLLTLSSIGLAWSVRDNSIHLQLRLVRSQELNRHLADMNVAAAGLAHETRNPLNIVRGMAQMITQEKNAPQDIQARAAKIVEEVDNVNYRLNEFIRYSRPAEPRPAPTDLLDVMQHVKTMLESDADEKGVSLEIAGARGPVLADESLLRQLLFNLMLNAIQAVNTEGHVRVNSRESGDGEVILSVEDDGSGVDPGLRDQVFSPYFTSREGGTGLGLAVVRQISLAHQWDVSCGQSEMGGAVFVVKGIKAVRSNAHK